MKQTNLFDFDCVRFELPDAELEYIPHFVTQAQKYFAQLKEELCWSQEEITLYGKKVRIPRLQAWHGDADAIYAYSGLPLQPNPWTPALKALKHACEEHLSCQFNSVLGNWYRDGQDSMGMHADNEPELGVKPVIAALSFGQTRTLKFRHRTKSESVDIAMESGSLLVMSGVTQQYWQHGISKSVKTMDERISLTFRRIYR